MIDEDEHRQKNFVFPFPFPYISINQSLNYFTSAGALHEFSEYRGGCSGYKYNYRG
jgi:hypothetical protein